MLSELTRDLQRLRAEIPSRMNRAARRRRKRAKPLTFRQYVDRVRPGFQWYRHAEVLAGVLQRVADGELARVMVFEPPRHGKSEEVSRLFPAYYLYRHPSRFVGLASYAAGLAYTLSRAARDNYRRGGGRLRGDARAVKQWETERGGGLWACGVGGEATGKGFHLGVIDDPLKNAEEAASETIRAKHKDWYSSTFYTRAEPGAAIVIVQTRWHEDDLSGWLLGEEAGDEPERWHIVNFAAIKEETDPEFPDTCTVEPDWREAGEPLCPERYPLARLRQIAKRIGEYFWNALFQQRPRPREGLMFRRGWFEVVGALPVRCVFVRYWDKAGADVGKGDYTVGVLMARAPDGTFYVVDVVRGQWKAKERGEVMRQTAIEDRRRYGHVKTFVEQPPGLAKESTEGVIKGPLAGFAAKADPVSKDKVERAEPYSAQCEAGNVKVLSADWNRPYFNELEGFPNAKHDDQVDASSGAFNKIAFLGRMGRLGSLERALKARR